MVAQTCTRINHRMWLFQILKHIYCVCGKNSGAKLCMCAHVMSEGMGSNPKEGTWRLCFIRFSQIHKFLSWINIRNCQIKFIHFHSEFILIMPARSATAKKGKCDTTSGGGDGAKNQTKIVSIVLTAMAPAGDAIYICLNDLNCHSLQFPSHPSTYS